MTASYCLPVRQFLLLLMCALWFHNSQAQDDAPFNKVTVSVLNPMHFSYSNAMELLQPKVIHNALELAVKIKQENTGVYAQVNYSGLSEDLASNLLSLRLTSKTSPDAVVSNTTVPLSAVPALVFMQPRSIRETKHYSFYYDLILNPVTTMIPPGNYSFSINFTITAE